MDFVGFKCLLYTKDGIVKGVESGYAMTGSFA